MRHGVRALLAFTLLSPPLFSAENNAPISQEVKVSLRNVWQYAPHADADADGKKEPDYSYISLLFDCPETMKLVSYSNLQAGPIETDSGEKLAHLTDEYDARDGEKVSAILMGPNGPKNAFSVTLRFSAYRKPFTALKKVKGQLHLRYATSEWRLIVDGYGGLKEGDQIKDERLGERELYYVGGREVQRAYFFMSFDLAKAFKGLRFVDARGVTARPRWRSSGSTYKFWCTAFEEKGDTPAKAMFDFWKGVKDEIVKFDLPHVSVEAPAK